MKHKKKYFSHCIILIFLPGLLSAGLEDVFGPRIAKIRAGISDITVITPEEIPNTLSLPGEFLKNPLKKADEFSAEAYNDENFKNLTLLSSFTAGLMDYRDVQNEIPANEDSSLRPSSLDEESISILTKKGRPEGMGDSIDSRFRGNDRMFPLQQEINVIMELIDLSQQKYSSMISGLSPEYLKDLKKVMDEEDIISFESITENNLSNTVKTQRILARAEEISLKELSLDFLEIISLTEKIAVLLTEEKNRNPAAPGQYEYPAGKVIVSGPGDDYYQEELLRETALIIDTGGKNRYKGNPAFGIDGKVRIVIDLGSDIEVVSDGPSCGAGYFGTGIFYAPDIEGKKSFDLMDRSAGCGIFGFGAFYTGGKVELTAGDYSAGSGKFGAGIFFNKGNGSRISSGQFSQGAGHTRGAGVCYYEGEDSIYEAGLSDPDPREEKGRTSLSQGFGYGSRAVSGGGIGVLKIKGNRNEIKSSYMAQGCGYWLGLGYFHIEGDNNIIRARRYAQGAGVHFASGMMVLKGNGNEQTNWGVGPAYGWDSSVGIYRGSGNNNTVRAEWGTAHGDAGASWAFFHWAGDNNIFSLPEPGSGSEGKKSVSCGAAVIEGKNNSFYSETDFSAQDIILMYNPWGVFYGEDVKFISEKLPEVKWEPVLKPGRRKREGRSLQGILDEAGSKTGFDRLSLLFSVASAFSTRPDIEQSAVIKMLEAGNKELPLIFDLYSPYRVEEIVPLTLIINSFGGKSVPEIKKRLKKNTGFRKMAYLSLLRGKRISAAVPVLLKSLEDPDWRIRVSAVRTLGYIFSTEKGPEPGWLSFIEHCLAISKNENIAVDEWIKKTGEKTLLELFSVAALTGKFSIEDKTELFRLSPVLFGNANAAALKYFAGMILLDKNKYTAVLKKELKEAQKNEKKVREKIREILKNNDSRLYPVSISALGQIGNPADSEIIAGFLNNEKMPVRENSLWALSQLGEAGYEKLSGPHPAIGALGAFHSNETSFLALLGTALKSSDTDDILAGLSVARSIRDPLKPKLKLFIKEITGLAEHPSPGIRCISSKILLFPPFK